MRGQAVVGVAEVPQVVGDDPRPDHVGPDHVLRRILRDEDAELYYMRSVIEEETRRLIFTAIDSLPEHCRKVCLLNLEGMDNQEIADELQVSLNTVKFHKKNAYKLLRDKLKDQFYLLFLI